MRKIITIIALTVLSGIALGQTSVKVGLLYYGITSESTVSVTSELPDGFYNEGPEPAGHISIPPTVKIKDKTYTVTSIDNYTFSTCQELVSVNIPHTVTSIGEEAFSGCPKLASINVDAANPAYSSQDGVLYNKNKTSLHFYPTTKAGGFTIPNSVTNIADKAFLDCFQLTNIIIPNSVKSIGNEAFYNCAKLTNINIPNSVTTIGNKAFCSCSGLTSINIPNSVTNIGNSAFLDCTGLASINIPNSVTTIGEDAFWSCTGLTSINVDAANPAYTSQDGVLYNKTKTILYTCPAKKTGEFVIPNTVTSIKDGAFLHCSELTSIKMPNSVTSIGIRAFYECSKLTDINIANSVTEIKRDAFYGCSGLTSINIPNSVTNIGEGAFFDCSGLTSINIPNSVTEIEEDAFGGCMELQEVTVNWDTPLAIAKNIFYEVPIDNVTLRVPAGTVELYRQADGWGNFGNIVEKDKKVAKP